MIPAGTHAIVCTHRHYSSWMWVWTDPATNLASHQLLLRTGDFRALDEAFGELQRTLLKEIAAGPVALDSLSETARRYRPGLTETGLVEGVLRPLERMGVIVEAGDGGDSARLSWLLNHYYTAKNFAPLRDDTTAWDVGRAATRPTADGSE